MPAIHERRTASSIGTWRTCCQIPGPPGAIIQGTLAQYPIANTWERLSRSNLDSFEFGINAAPEQGKWQKFEFDISYAFLCPRRISTVNPFTVRADSIIHAGANPYPDTVVRRQDVNIAITRRINESFEIGVRIGMNHTRRMTSATTFSSPTRTEL